VFVICSSPIWLITTSVFGQSPSEGNVTRTDAGDRTSPDAVRASKSYHWTTVWEWLHAANTSAHTTKLPSRSPGANRSRITDVCPVERSVIAPSHPSGTDRTRRRYGTPSCHGKSRVFGSDGVLGSGEGVPSKIERTSLISA